MYWIAFGDIHESTAVIDTIPDLNKAEGVIITGDLTNMGSDAQARKVIDAIERLNPVILAQPGNMDTDEVTRYLQNRNMLIHRKVHPLANGLCLLGIGYSTPTPFGTPGEVPEADIAAWLAELDRESADFPNRILAIHEPPKDSSCDRINDGLHVGSQAIRDFIEHARLDLVVTGHIHESAGSDIIGGTPVINPGMIAGGGYVRIDYNGETVTATLESI